MPNCVRALLAAAALLASLSLNPHAQSSDPTSRFVPSPITEEFVPAVQTGLQRQLTVVLTMVGDPVAVVRSRRPGKQMSDAEKDAIEHDLRVQQEALVPAIESRGGRVLAMFQNAINGIKVRGAPDQIGAFATLPGVVAVKPVMTHRIDNATSVPFIGAPAVWDGGTGFHGESLKIAIIDTGIDYTHANFGGPGTPAAFATAFANSTAPADPTLFGPAAPKVKGGIDLVGDAYDASSADPTKVIPHPDPNPLDCNGHGSHVAGTAAGFGVTTTGARFLGPYTASTPTVPFRIGPGVAPLADLYAVRVFGCSGSTDVVVEALDWAVQNGMQVVNMSLGSLFGTEDSADAEASEHAAEAGIIVVASAGNSGPGTYITGSPASGNKTISVAAMDAISPATFPGVNLALNTGPTILAQNSNGASVTPGPLQIFVLPDTLGTGSGGVSLGCNDSEYVGATGKLVVAFRGVCARVDRAVFGQHHGAAGVVMINNAAGFPPFEGPIPGVTIPFLGLRGPSATTGDGAAVKAAATATLSNTTIPNTSFHKFATFSSGGPRNGDGRLKPDITAPGVNVVSTAVGSGNGAATFSGTSMAAPHVAGVAALALQAHPGWDPADVRLAIVDTATAAPIPNYRPRLGGSGLVQPFPATRTQVVAGGTDDSGSLSFGVAEFSSDFVRAEHITLRNLGSHSASFSVSVNQSAGSSSHSAVAHPTTVSVMPGHDAKVEVELTVPAATMGDSAAFRDVAGLITLTPTIGNDGVALNVPYYLVPRARSRIETELTDDFGPARPSATATVRNHSASVVGTADFYAWGLAGFNKKLGSTGLRAVGVQSFPFGGGNSLLVFAVNTFAPWSNAATKEFDVLLDVDGDGVADFAVFSFDLGALTTGGFTGQVASAVFNFHTGKIRIRFLAVAPTDGNTLLLPALASDVGVTSANPRFTYVADGLDLLSGNFDVMPGEARFNAFENAISTGAFESLPPRSRASVPLSINPAEWQVTPALGVMVVGLENFTHHEHSQAQLLSVGADDDGEGH